RASAHPELAGSHALGLDRELARRAAVASTVILHDNGVLPLTLSGDEPVLLTGPFASEQRALLGTWVLDGDPSEVARIAPALRSAVEEALGAEAAARLIIDEGSFPDHTVRLSREAGTTIALVGEHPWRSGEDGSVSELGLPPGQLEVLRAIARLGSRLVVVVFAGRPLALGEVLELADAVILAWHPGVEAGEALADVLLGRAAASGRLPVSLPRSMGHLPITHAEPPSGRPLPEDPRGRGRYIDSPTAPLLPFGFGATRVGYGRLRAETPQIDRMDGIARLNVTLTNPTARAAREPVLLFLRDEVAEVTRPVRELVDLQVVDVPANGSLEVSFELPVGALGYHGRDHTFRVDPGRVVLTVGWPRPDASSVSLEVH
ncbi:MAG: glycoside hydrolase family 3 C-terminal domain-containing protein, partial [Propionibacteriaceae bacterium]|nr:glycoside hydrolase family 3 C-terminal domain-containing protein [Propionibacteriaceae bacterium]